VALLGKFEKLLGRPVERAELNALIRLQCPQIDDMKTQREKIRITAGVPAFFIVKAKKRNQQIT